MRDHTAEFSDFTESGYRKCLRAAKLSYAFVRFGETCKGRQVLWRHDIDVSVHRARRLAEIEKEESVIATYFVFPRCMFYNVFNSFVAKEVDRILSLGHDLGLHFDPTQRPHAGRNQLIDAMGYERDLLKREFGVSPVAVSFHLYGILETVMPDEEVVAGMINAYSKILRKTCGYVSDSNGVWLYRRLTDVLANPTDDRLQVLTHPEWWTPDTMPPRARLQRAIDGYADAMGRWYDNIVARSGRPNIR